MGSLTNLGERAALDQATGVSPASARYLALYSAAPGEAGGGTELAGDGYARQLITFGAAATDAAITTAANDGEVLFPEAPDAWLEATHIAILTALEAGDMIWHGPLTTPRTAASGDQIRFAIGAVVCSMS